MLDGRVWAGVGRKSWKETARSDPEFKIKIKMMSWSCRRRDEAERRYTLNGTPHGGYDII